MVPLLDGNHRAYVNLDNAATTPALVAVREAVDAYLPWYSSVHRGSGFKSRLATSAYENARCRVARFFGAGDQDRLVIFGKNATEALNKLAARFPFESDDIVLTTIMEHHSNMLPWRARTQLDYIDVLPDGSLDLADLAVKLDRNQGRVRLVAVTGASNVTGYVPPIHLIARLAHQHGAQIVVDGAQLAPHRKIDMKPVDDPGHIDFLAISGHKLYAPYGTGALIGPREFFCAGEPDQVGGGTVKIVTLQGTVWADAPEKEEAGSPNTIGAIALAAACEALDSIGMDRIAAHERRLTTYALNQLRTIPALTILGSADPTRTEDRLGVLTFTIDGLHNSLVSAVLGWEHAVGIRSGCFCAHPYMLRLLGISDDAAEVARGEIEDGDKRNIPGAARISLGLYNTEADIDAAVLGLKTLVRGESRGTYVQDVHSGAYVLEGPPDDFVPYFSIGNRIRLEVDQDLETACPAQIPEVPALEAESNDRVGRQT